VRIGVVGDVHLVWDRRDVQLLDGAGYDLVLFVGDLAGYGPKGALRVAKTIGKLSTPALVLPGNHDAVTLPQLAAEVLGHSETLRHVLSLGMERRVERLRRTLVGVPLCGYSLHPFDALDLTILAARPHSIGGPRLAFQSYLTRRFGIGSIEDSAARLCALLDEVPVGRRTIVLAHCGPHGLGATRDAIFGCDFREDEGDWGDPDLSLALAHASRTGKNVLAVVAGHMHHHLRGGGERRWQQQDRGILHVNAAQVPRTRRRESRHERHHVCLTLDGPSLSAEPVWLPLPRRLSLRRKVIAVANQDRL
jgi:uncharacterized protein (TIGR04168 family)